MKYVLRILGIVLFSIVYYSVINKVDNTIYQQKHDYSSVSNDNRGISVVSNPINSVGSQSESTINYINYNTSNTIKNHFYKNGLFSKIEQQIIKSYFSQYLIVVVCHNVLSSYNFV